MKNFHPITNFKAISYLDIYERFLRSDEKYMMRLKKIISSKEIPTFKNVIEKWSEIRIESSYYFTLLSLYNNSGLFDKYKGKYNKVTYKDNKSTYWIYHNQELFSKIEFIINNEKLDDEQYKIIEEIYKNYIFSGINLSKEDQKKAANLNYKIAGLASQIEANINNHNQELGMIIRLDQDLSEMPEEWLNNAKKMAKGKGYLVNDTNSSVFYKMCKSSKLKSDYGKIINELASVAPYNNSPLIEELIKTYNEFAKLKGFDSYQEYALHNKAFTSDEIKKVLEKILKKTRSYAVKEKKFFEREGLKLGIKKVTGNDTTYISEQVNKNNVNKIKDFLEISTIFKGMNLMISMLFGCHMEKSNKKSIHKYVDVYTVFRNKKEIGQIHFDILSRKGKNDIASMGTLQSPSRQCRYGQAFIQADIDPNDIDIYDYITMFHELGHAMHVLLSNTRYDLSAGCGISRDLIEVPSTIFEKLSLNHKFMNLFLRNKYTHEKVNITKETFSKDHDNIIQLRSRVVMSLVDLKVYEMKEISIKNIHNIEFKNFKEHGMFYKKKPTYCYSNSFSHVFGGDYESIYYSYFIAEVIASGIALKFNNKISNWKLKGKWLLDSVYSRGTSISSKKMLHQLVGKEIDYDSFLESQLN